MMFADAPILYKITAPWDNCLLPVKSSRRHSEIRVKLINKWFFGKSIPKAAQIAGVYRLLCITKTDARGAAAARALQQRIRLHDHGAKKTTAHKLRSKL